MSAPLANATGNLHQELYHFRAAGDTPGEASTLNNLGMAHAAHGDYDGALAYYKQALPLRREMEDTRGEAISLHKIAGVYESLHDPSGHSITSTGRCPTSARCQTPRVNPSPASISP